MSNAEQDQKQDQAEDAVERAEGSEEVAPEEVAQAEPAEAEEDEATRAARLAAEVAELRDQLLRTLAEAENQRRRSQREREEARDLVAVADNLQRALESVPGDGTEQDGALKILLEGVELTRRELDTVFERHGIVKLDAAPSSRSSSPGISCTTGCCARPGSAWPKAAPRPSRRKRRPKRTRLATTAARRPKARPDIPDIAE
jgi:molecular chaperone GrpE (heat shock protein)